MANAFNAKLNPCGVKLKAMFSSDISHWDVVNMEEVLQEAWELVEHDLVDTADFRNFAFANIANLRSSDFL